MHLTFDGIPFSRLFLAVLLHFLWQAGICVTAIAIARSLIHPKYFQVRYLISVAGLIAVLIFPLATAGYYIAHPAAMTSLNPPVAMDLATTNVAQASPGIVAFFDTQFQIVFGWFDQNRFFWLGCWTAGFVLLFSRLGVSLAHCHRLRRNRSPLPENLHRLADGLKKHLDLSKNVIVAVSHDITQAIATGIIKPVVLVPAAWISNLPISSIEAVLAHELAHIKRFDLWVNLIQRVAETVFFFHPAVWWLSNRISGEREVCCDRLAIQITGQPVCYVETLVLVAETDFSDDIELQLGTAFIGGKNMNLLRRARMVLEPTSVDGRTPFRTLALITCLGLMLSFASYAYCAAVDQAAAMQDRDNHAEREQHGDHDDDDHQGHDNSNRNRFVHDDDLHEVTRSDLHNHLVELLHSDTDHQQLARMLRALAEELELSHANEHGEHDNHDHGDHEHGEHDEHGNHEQSDHDRNIDVEVIRDRRQGHHVREFELKRVPQGPNKNMEVPPEELHSYLMRRTAEPDEIVVKITPRKNGQSDERIRRQDTDRNFFVERARQNSESRDTRREMHFEHADQSDGDLGRAIRDLKNEVQQLRHELNQLRSQGSTPKTDQRWRSEDNWQYVDPRQQKNLLPRRDDGPKDENRFEYRDEKRDHPTGESSQENTFRWIEPVLSKNRRNIEFKVEPRNVDIQEPYELRNEKDIPNKVDQNRRVIEWLEKSRDDSANQSKRLDILAGDKKDGTDKFDRSKFKLDVRVDKKKSNKKDRDDEDDNDSDRDDDGQDKI